MLILCSFTHSVASALTSTPVPTSNKAEPESGFIEAAGQRLEYLSIAGRAAGAPTIVLLHEGLGCVSMWKNFPALVHELTGLPVFVYTRAGYAGSSAAALPRGVDYMHREALDVLPAVLAAAGIDRCVLLGHSDGATIALIYAGGPPRQRSHECLLSGLVLMAPHVFCEARSLAGIRAADRAFREGNLREGLRWHHGEQVDAAFRGWRDVWLSEDFAEMNICEYLPAIEAPALLIQGEGDEYGTLSQLDAIEHGVNGPVTRLVLKNCGHAPHRERPDEVLRALSTFMHNHALQPPHSDPRTGMGEASASHNQH